MAKRVRNGIKHLFIFISQSDSIFIDVFYLIKFPCITYTHIESILLKAWEYNRLTSDAIYMYFEMHSLSSSYSNYCNIISHLHLKFLLKCFVLFIIIKIEKYDLTLLHYFLIDLQNEPQHFQYSSLVSLKSRHFRIRKSKRYFDFYLKIVLWYIGTIAQNSNSKV